MAVPQWTFFLAACAGSLIFEVVHWYDLRGKLPSDQLMKMARSWLYWVITLAMIVGSGVISIIWYSGEDRVVPLKEYFIAGAVAPLLFKKLISTITDRQPTLGDTTFGASDVVKAYFR
jgi:hypothetical protein